MIRYALLLVAFAYVGRANTVSAVKVAGMIYATGKLPAGPTEMKFVSSQDSTNPDSKRFLRHEAVVTRKDDIDVNSTEERAIIGSALKNGVFKILASRGILPQTIYVKLGIRSGKAPAFVHWISNNYQR
ncbi:hypothetical protein L915_20470 [Phytophthora nicotianae]|uniref:RxLR effector protein n=1 Tax=Phytophthora nicotianae TaxID=4792 RepID=W2FQX9_PHYNI|nr:hypothetical protein L915_20470 [Phytophthora nicotianae]